MKRREFLVMGGLTAGSMALSIFGNETRAPSAPHNKFQWGIFTGTGKREDIEKLENEVGLRSDLIPTFVGMDWGYIAPELMSHAWYTRKKILVYWEAKDQTLDAKVDDRFSLPHILRGDHDTYFNNFANSIRGYDGPIDLCLWPEINIDIMPQSQQYDRNRALFADTLEYIAHFFNGLPQVRLGVGLNARSIPEVPGNAIEDYRPGKSARFVGIDVFNHGPPNSPWLRFDEIGSQAFEIVSHWGLEMWATSIACAPGPRKAAWWDNSLDIMKSLNLTGMAVFAMNKEGQGVWERDWRLDQDSLRVLSRQLKS